MSVARIDLDDGVLAEAMRQAGSTTASETVNAALREYVARHRQVEALQNFAARAERWDHDSYRRLRAASKEPH